jgi:hypothetical protein
MKIAVSVLGHAGRNRAHARATLRPAKVVAALAAKQVVNVDHVVQSRCR